jgi:hypothetical protein
VVSGQKLVAGSHGAAFVPWVFWGGAKLRIVVVWRSRKSHAQRPVLWLAYNAGNLRGACLYPDFRLNTGAGVCNLLGFSSAKSKGKGWFLPLPLAGDSLSCLENLCIFILRGVGKRHDRLSGAKEWTAPALFPAGAGRVRAGFQIPPPVSLRRYKDKARGGIEI